MQVLFLRRKACGHSDRAESFLKLIFPKVVVVEAGGMGDRIPADVLDLDLAAVFCFRSHIILRADLLSKVKICLNFHPGPPERPGTGCVNFALFEGDARYGTTCHYVDEGIDSGPIVDVRYFPIYPSDGVASVLARTYDHMLCQLYDVAQVVAEGKAPEPIPVKWERTATRKKDMDRLREVPLDASPELLERHIRATSFGEYRPFVQLHGRRFVLAPEQA